ncbi:MAG: hypothetical protein ACRC9R_01735 [Enterovibrio sp.]
MNKSLQACPLYLPKGLRSQSGVIRRTCKKQERKLACLLEVISTHIQKSDSECFASTDRLTSMYNEAAPCYGVDPISSRTLFNLLNTLEERQLIARARSRVKSSWKTIRHITLNIDAIAKIFKGAVNWAISAAKGFIERCENSAARKQNFHNSHPLKKIIAKARHGAASQQSAATKTCSRSTNIKENKNNTDLGEGFFEKYFGENAKEVENLQQLARLGRITANGAKKLIKLHAKYGFELGTSFKKFLNHVIAKEKNRAATMQTYKKPQKAKQQTAFVMPDDNHVKEGIAEYYRDEIGRVHIRWKKETSAPEKEITSSQDQLSLIQKLRKMCR